MTITPVLKGSCRPKTLLIDARERNQLIKQCNLYLPDPTAGFGIILGQPKNILFGVHPPVDCQLVADALQVVEAVETNHRTDGHCRPSAVGNNIYCRLTLRHFLTIALTVSGT